MQAIKRSSFWVVGVLGLFASFVLQIALFSMPAHAEGEQFTYGAGDPPTITVSGGSRNIPSTTLNLVEGTNDRYGGEFSIPVNNPSSSNTSCRYTVVVTASPGSTQGTAGYSSNISSCFDPTFDDAVTIQGTAPGGGTGEPGEGAPGEGEETEEVQCTTESGLSWLMCPALEITMSANNVVAGVIDGLLQVNPLEVGGGDSSVIFNVWSNIRNLANVMLIFVLFAIIFSQATSTGISAYGIKRIMPRLVAGAVFINLSFFLCAIAIDIFNVLGYGIRDLLLSTLEIPIGAENTQTGTPDDPVGAVGFGLLQGIGWIFALAGVAAAVVIGLMFFSGTILLVLLVGLITLAARQAAIVILVILAPVAFAAWILPGTEKYFDKWKDIFIGLLIMFPLMMVIFAGSRVAAEIISGSAGDNFLLRMIGILIAILPVLALPLLFKAAGGIAGRVYGAMSGSKLGRGVGGGIDGIGRRMAKRGGENLEARAGKNQWGAGRAGRLGTAQRGIGRVVGAAGRYRSVKKYKESQQDASIQRSQQESIAAIASETDANGDPTKRAQRFAESASGIGGTAGVVRVQANATSILANLQDEELKNSMALLTSALRGSNTDAKTFSGALGSYLQASAPDASGNVNASAATAALNNLPATLRSFATDPEKLKAGLNLAASGGEVRTIENARSNANINQTIVDEVISRNDGPLKGKGGYHIATNFNLAAGRSALSSDGATAQVQMAQERVNGMAQTSASDITSWKAGMIREAATQMRAGIAPANPADRAQLKATLDSIINTPELRGKVTDNIQNIVDMHSRL